MSVTLFLYLLVLAGSGLISASYGLRCYTDVAATKSLSVECGLNTGCVKIYIGMWGLFSLQVRSSVRNDYLLITDTEEMMLKRQSDLGFGYGFTPPEGIPPLPDRYLGNPVLRRGCFVLAVPDRCYTAQNGLSYCWCSQKDLCNSAMPTFKGFQLTFATSAATIAAGLIVVRHLLDVWYMMVVNRSLKATLL